MTFETVFWLLIAFQLKHFLCDYPLQGRYMLGKFKPGWDFIPPLAAHCACHALFTFVIVGPYVGMPVAFASLMAAFDFGIHFGVDRLKAGPKFLGRFKTDQPYFWWALGFDQLCHQLTHYLIIAAIYLAK